MNEKIMVYYDLTVWETINVNDFDELKDRNAKFVKMLDGLGILSFKIRTGPEDIPEQETGVQSEQPAK